MSRRRGRSREEIMAKRHATLVATCRHAPLRDASAGDHTCPTCGREIHVASPEEVRARRARVGPILGVAAFLARH